MNSAVKLLFVCSRNRWRSPTAEHIFGKIAGIETTSAGTSADAENPLCGELVAWADFIFVMEAHHRKRINHSFGNQIRDKRIICLNIPDDYEYMDPVLIRMLWNRVPASVPELTVHNPFSASDEQVE